MTAHSVRSRLKKLEGRFGPAPPPFRMAIDFVDSTGEVTETLLVEEGKEMRSLPGNAPLPEDWFSSEAR